MTTLYTNLPNKKSGSSSDATVSVFDQYFVLPTELNNNVLVAVTGILENKGFDSSAAELFAISLLTQAKKDNVNPMEVVSKLGDFSSDEISNLLMNIANFYRYKTSFIGIATQPIASNEVYRNVLP